MASSSAQRNVLVTGGNDGIGFEITTQLVQKGLKVFLGARNEEKGKNAVYVFLSLLFNLIDLF